MIKKIIELIDNKAYDKAFEFVEKALLENHDKLELLCAKAEILKYLDKLSEAVNLYIKIIELYPDYKKAQIKKDLLHTVMIQDNIDIFASTNLFDDPWEII